MQELSRPTRTRLLTDIAFATTLAAVASFSIAAAQEQTKTPPDKSTTAETRASPAPPEKIEGK
jgi:hypothetical protein